MTQTEYQPFGAIVDGPLADGAPPAHFPETFAVVKLRREADGTTVEYDVVDYIAAEHFTEAGFRVHEVVGVYDFDGDYECFRFTAAADIEDGTALAARRDYAKALAL